MCAVVGVLLQKRELSGQCLEFTRSPGKMRLEKVETGIFQEVRNLFTLSAFQNSVTQLSS